jgi:hypothetical protein
MLACRMIDRAQTVRHGAKRTVLVNENWPITTLVCGEQVKWTDLENDLENPVKRLVSCVIMR